MKKQVILIFYPESIDFVKAVEDLSAFVKRWGNCDVMASQNMCMDDTLLQQTVNEYCNGQFISIILSEHINMIYEILNHGDNLPTNTDLQARFIFELLKKVHSEGKQKTIISFFPVQLENLLLKEEKILTVTEVERTRANTNKANLKHIYQLFQRIHDNQFSIATFKESVAAGNEQMKELLDSIQKLPRGIITGDKLDNSNIPAIPDKQQVSSPGNYLTVGNNNMNQHETCEKHLKTLEWAEEPKWLQNGHAHIKWPSSGYPCEQNGTSPSVKYHPVRNTKCDLTCTCDQSCEDNDTVFGNGHCRHGLNQPRNISFAGEKSIKKPKHGSYKSSRNGLCRPAEGLSTSNKVLKSLRDDTVFPAADGMLQDEVDFIPPDSDLDDDSDSASMYFEQINKRYFETIKQQHTSHL